MNSKKSSDTAYTDNFDSVGADAPPQLRSQSTDKRLSAAMTAKRKGRDNIFAEKINVDEPWQPKNFPKSPKTRKLLENIMKSHYNLHALFQSLSDNLIKLTIDAMEERNVEANEVVIREGESGDYFYLIETGTFEALKGGKVVTTMSESDSKFNSFGELALLYNCPRAATVRALTPGKLWALDRSTFRHTLAAQDHQQKGDTVSSLRSVPLLSELTQQQFNAIADAVQPVHFTANERIIMKGEPGSIFYIVKSGVVTCTDIGEGDRMADVRLKAESTLGACARHWRTAGR